MWRRFVRCAGIIPILGNAPNEYDRDTINTKYTVPKTGWERVKRMYTKNELEEFSVEIYTVAQSALCGAFFGAVMGGFSRSRDAYVYFIENNQATIFKSTMQAKKQLQDYVTVSFAKGAYQWGWRLGTFSGIFTLIATTISVYQGETSIAEYIAAGTLTGGIYRMHLGLAATIVGAGLGAVLSTVAGLTVVAILKITGFSMADIRGALYSLKEAREDQYNQALKKASAVDNDPLTKHHDEVLASQGKMQEL